MPEVTVRAEARAASRTRRRVADAQRLRRRRAPPAGRSVAVLRRRARRGRRPGCGRRPWRRSWLPSWSTTSIGPSSLGGVGDHVVVGDEVALTGRARSRSRSRRPSCPRYCASDLDGARQQLLRHRRDRAVVGRERRAARRCRRPQAAADAARRRRAGRASARTPRRRRRRRATPTTRASDADHRPRPSRGTPAARRRGAAAARRRTPAGSGAGGGYGRPVGRRRRRRAAGAGPAAPRVRRLLLARREPGRRRSAAVSGAVSSVLPGRSRGTAVRGRRSVPSRSARSWRPGGRSRVLSSTQGASDRRRAPGARRGSAGAAARSARRSGATVARPAPGCERCWSTGARRSIAGRVGGRGAEGEHADHRGADRAAADARPGRRRRRLARSSASSASPRGQPGVARPMQRALDRSDGAAAPPSDSPASRVLTQPSRSTASRHWWQECTCVPGPLLVGRGQLAVEERADRAPRWPITRPITASTPGAAAAGPPIAGAAVDAGRGGRAPSRSMARPRWMRERTVPSLTSRISAISS